MSDPFEKLGVASRTLSKYSASVCLQMGAPIDYKVECPEMAVEAINSPSSGPQVFRWRKVEMEARLILKHCFRFNDPSPYKICSAVTLSMLANAPIPNSIPEEVVRERDLHEIFLYRHSLAALASMSYCLRMLHTARVGDQNFELEPLVLSDHFLIDFIATLAAEAKRIEEHGLSNPQASFGFISILYEACSYIKNPDAQNEDRTEFRRPTQC